MTATTPPTPTYTYRAQTDPGTKKWHLGATELGAKCFCGTLLVTPGDTRKFALKLPVAERDYQVDTALDCVSCAACKRSKNYANAQAQQNPEAAREARMGESELASHTRNRRREHRATVTPAAAAEMAAAAADAAADHAAPPSRRRGRSKADRAAAKAAEDTARREALDARADATVAAIEAAVAEATGEAPLTRTGKAAALMASGLATSRADARAQLADMGE